MLNAIDFKKASTVILSCFLCLLITSCNAEAGNQTIGFPKKVNQNDANQIKTTLALIEKKHQSLLENKKLTFQDMIKMMNKEKSKVFEDFNLNRVSLYQGARHIIRNARKHSMTTTIDFKEDKKTYNWGIFSPNPSQWIMEHPKSFTLSHRLVTGNKRRLRGPHASASGNQGVNFSLTLIEPDASEKDPRVTIDSSVTFKLSDSYIRNHANLDMLAVRKMIEN